MSENYEVPEPILNSPFEEPKEHWYIREGESPERRSGRRPAGYFYRDPRAPAGDTEHEARGEWQELALVNLIRGRITSWREQGWPGVTGTTLELLNYWQREGRQHRLFFAQLEAAETTIFLTEARADFRQGIETPLDEPSDDRKADGYSVFRRYACKMATGSGKTVVMALLMAWAFCNRGRTPADTRYPKRALVVCPNLTIKERLSVLRTGDPENYFDKFDLVPTALRPELAKGRVLVTNWHTFSPEAEELRVGGVTVGRLGPETPEAFARARLGDLILIAFVASAVVVSGLRGAGALLLIGAGLLVWTGADSIYLYQEATSSYQEGWLDSLWLVGAFLVAFAACFSVRHAPVRQSVYHSPLWVPGMAALVSVGILVWDHFDRVHAASIWLAGATLGAVTIRLLMSFRENRRLVEALHTEAISDALTGLGNRRRLMSDLEWLLAHGESHYLALFDLDGFKSYNDSFGHPAGDALLRQLGGRLAVSVGPGNAYRLGGDEFCILVPCGDLAAEHVVEAARSALSARGEGFNVGASSGHAVLPEEAGTPSEALRIVDQRMYAEKSGRSTRVAHQTHELLLRILREREPELGEHVEGVARMATDLARLLDVDSEDVDVIRRAAELHDIGKIAIPEEILSKPGPLDEREWDLMRRHTLVGERILGAAPALRPVAVLVRASHERWDGKGYPDGVAGSDIPLGARIIFVCDAFDAMTSARAYRPAMHEEDAIAELRRGAGTQFDPQVVELFAQLWSTDRRSGDADTAAGDALPAALSGQGSAARS